MSSGANIGDGSPDGIGDAPTDMGVWEKFQLGWLAPQGDKGPFYEVARAGQKSDPQARPEHPGHQVSRRRSSRCCPTSRSRTTSAPRSRASTCTGARQGDELETTMTKTGVTAGTLTAKVNYQIEEDWDYAFLEASPERHHVDADQHQQVPDHRPQRPEPGLRHHRQLPPAPGSTSTGTLPAGTTQVRFRYWTDVAATEPGIKIDNIALNGTSIGTAEADEGWTFDGFVRTTGTEIQKFFNAYVAGEPPVRRLRQVAEDGVQLRLPQHPSRLGGEPALPGRPAHLLLEREVHRQQRRRPPRRRPDPPGGCPPGLQPLAGRHADASAHPVG